MVQDGLHFGNTDSSLPGEDETAFLEFSGELDIATAPELREQLASVEVLDAPRVHVDLKQVTFLDSSTIGLLATTCKRIRAAGGSFSITCGEGHVRRVFEVSGLIDYFEIEDAS